MYLGIDIGGTTTKLGVADAGGTLIREASFRTSAYANAHQFLEALDGEIIRMVSLLDHHIQGIGLGAPSANFRTGVIENAANLGWKGKLDIKQHLEKSTGCRVMVTNDANLPAIGEMTYGGARGMQNFITVSLGTGLGSGLVCNGKLVGGYHGMAGELGHTCAVAGGRNCGCGRKGCLETYVSATGLKRTVSEALSHDLEYYSVLREFSFEEMTAEHIHEAALDGDRLAKEAFHRTGGILGRQLADLVCITDPEAVFLVGGLAKAGDLLFKPTKQALQRYMLSNFESDLEIRSSSLPLDKLSLLGACGLVSSNRSSKVTSSNYNLTPY